MSYKVVLNMLKKRLPAIVDRGVWEKVTKGRAGTRWDSVVQKARKDIGRSQEEVMPDGKFRRYKAEEVEEMIGRRERLGLRNKVESGKKNTYIRDMRGIEGRNWNENVFARPDELRKNAETAL